MGSSSFIFWAKEVKSMGKRGDQLCLENASLFKPWGRKGKKCLNCGFCEWWSKCAQEQNLEFLVQIFFFWARVCVWSSTCLWGLLPREGFWTFGFVLSCLRLHIGLTITACSKGTKIIKCFCNHSHGHILGGIAKWLCKLSISVKLMNEFRKCNKGHSNEKIWGKNRKSHELLEFSSASNLERGCLAS